MPPGGDGVYYFSFYIFADSGEFAFCDMKLNGAMICTAEPGHYQSRTDPASGSCSVVVRVVAGNV